MNPQPNLSWRWTGGKFDACDSVPVADRGFRHGMSVFESLPVRGGTPFFPAAHYERLKQACAQGGMETTLPGLEAFDALLRGVEFDAFARIYVTAGEGGIFSDTTNGNVFVFIEPRKFDDTPEPAGYRLARCGEPHTPIIGGLKTANYWPNVLALQAARKQQCDEALIFNRDGGLISASMANAFIVQDGKIKTPAIDCGARKGVIREWVMGRREVKECIITTADLDGAEEIFLTNSGIGVMPVASFDGRALHSRDIALQLRVEYLAKIAEGW